MLKGPQRSQAKSPRLQGGGPTSTRVAVPEREEWRRQTAMA